MSIGADIYNNMLKDRRKHYECAINNGEISEDEADFEMWLDEDYMLDYIPDELFEN